MREGPIHGLPYSMASSLIPMARVPHGHRFPLAHRGLACVAGGAPLRPRAEFVELLPCPGKATPAVLVFAVVAACQDCAVVDWQDKLRFLIDHLGTQVNREHVKRRLPTRQPDLRLGELEALDAPFTRILRWMSRRYGYDAEQ